MWPSGRAMEACRCWTSSDHPQKIQLPGVLRVECVWYVSEGGVAVFGTLSCWATVLEYRSLTDHTRLHSAQH